MSRRRCRTCSAPVVWAVTEAGRKAPFDSLTTTKGTHTVVSGRATFVPEAKRSGQLYTSHFATCPQASEHRRAQPLPSEPVPASPPPGPVQGLVQGLELVLSRLDAAGAFLVGGRNQPALRAARLHLMTGQPYRYVCGRADELADVQHPSVAQARVAAAELALWEQRRVGQGSWLVWQRVSEHVEGWRTTSYLAWADLVLTDDVLTHVGGAPRCRACSGLGHTWPSDDRCAVCRGHGRVAQLVSVQGATP